MKEDYVSFEIAKLLKEKGFHELCHYNYHCYGFFYQHKEKDYNGKNYEKLNSEWYSAPSLAMAMAWLREKYKLNIIISVDDLDWFYSIIDYTHKGDVKLLKDLAGFNSYESACEDAIKYCLTNLV